MGLTKVEKRWETGKLVNKNTRLLLRKWKENEAEEEICQAIGPNIHKMKPPV